MVIGTNGIPSAELLRRAQGGDAVSLGELLAHYTNYMEVLSQAQLDGRVRRRVSSSDVVQETMLEAHRDFEKFSGSTMAEFTGWLRKILIHNLARTIETHLLAAKRDVRQEHALEEVDSSMNRSHARFASMLADQGRSPLSEADHQEALVRMANAITNLAPEYRQVIVLRHLEGLPFKEVAERMKRTPGAARMLWMRAIERLREAMN